MQEQFRQGCRRITGYVDDKEVYVKNWYQDMGFEDITRKYDFHMYSSPSPEFYKEFVTGEAPHSRGRSCRVPIHSFSQ